MQRMQRQLTWTVDGTWKDARATDAVQCACGRYFCVGGECIGDYPEQLTADYAFCDCRTHAGEQGCPRPFTREEALAALALAKLNGEVTNG